MTNIIVLLKVHYSVTGSYCKPVPKAVRSPADAEFIGARYSASSFKAVLKDKNIHHTIV